MQGQSEPRGSIRPFRKPVFQSDGKSFTLDYYIFFK